MVLLLLFFLIAVVNCNAVSSNSKLDCIASAKMKGDISEVLSCPYYENIMNSPCFKYLRQSNELDLDELKILCPNLPVEDAKELSQLFK